MTIKKACEVQVGDTVVVPVYNTSFPRGIHGAGIVKEIKNPHPDVTELVCDLLAHCEGNTGQGEFAIRHNRKVLVL